MKKIDVTIIIPVYNVEAYVESCLRSVMEQEHGGFDVECIIVDDRGQDGSMDVVRRTLDTYKGDIEFKIIEHDKNRGLSAARNTAIRAARGKYVTFLDSDDRLLPGALAGMYQLTVKYPGVDIVQGELFLNRSDKGLGRYLNVSAVELPEYVEGKTEARHIILFEMPVVAVAKLVRRDFITENCLYFYEGMIHEDDMWAVSASKYIERIAFYFTPVYWYNNGLTNSITSTPDKTRSMLARVDIIKNAVQCFEAKPCSSYLKYIVWKLEISQKSNIWNYVRDKAAAKDSIHRLLHYIAKSSCPSSVRLAAWYFSLPLLISDSRLVRPFWRRIISKIADKQIQSYNYLS